MMKKTIAILLSAVTLSCMATEKNLVPNGDFEQIGKTAKGTDKYLINQIKGGWDIGAGPVAVLPKRWLLNGGKGKLRVITVGDNGENKENVHGGKHAIFFEEMNGHVASGCSIPPGKYELSFWYKGTGTFSFGTYDYGIHPATGKVGKFVGGSQICTIRANSPDKWTQHKVVFEIGKNKPAVKRSTVAHYGNKGGYYLDDVVVKAVK